MSSTSCAQFLKLAAAAALVAPLAVADRARAADSTPSPCSEDAMIVFDASGSMAGNVSQGIATIKPRIDEARHALAAVLPRVARYRRVGLVTYGPGAYNQCNVQLKFEPTPNAAQRIMREVNSLTPAGRTPLTSAVEAAADVLDYRKKPGLIVLLTDGEETCGRSPCDLGRQLHASAAELTVHVISYRTANFSWVGENSILDTKCLAEENNGFYITAYNYQELVDAFEKALDCPMIAGSTLSWGSERIGNTLESQGKGAKLK
jgi:Ca-activated chloride channel family protein